MRVLSVLLKYTRRAQFRFAAPDHGDFRVGKNDGKFQPVIRLLKRVRFSCEHPRRIPRSDFALLDCDVDNLERPRHIARRENVRLAGLLRRPRERAAAG